jgi:hypothetical protein
MSERQQIWIACMAKVRSSRYHHLGPRGSRLVAQTRNWHAWMRLLGLTNSLRLERREDA